MNNNSDIRKTAAIPLKPELLHLNYREKSAFRTYIEFFKDDAGKLFWAFFFFLIKYSPMWVIPIITANIINTVEHPQPDTVWVLLEQLLIADS